MSFPALADHASTQQNEVFKVRGHFQAGVNFVSERDLFWNLADVFAASTNYNPDKDWIEYYAKPGVSFSYSPNEVTVYGKASLVASYTKHTDAYDFGNTGRVTLEEGYLGFRAPVGNGIMLDASIGPREFKLGTGMLIANGATSGFERGALKFGPRKAWEMSGIARLKSGGFSATGFYVDPNEVPSVDNKNRLAGADVRFDASKGAFAGLSYIHVLKSNNAYPQVFPGTGGAPTVITGAREGLNALNFYGRSKPITNPFGTALLALDAAYQWHDHFDMSAWGGRFIASHTFSDARWKPTLAYTLKTFSGDAPTTAQQERFDPLYYDGNPSTWATGSKSSMTFINSNVRAHELAVSVSPSPKDKVTLRYAHIRANELRSPIQFGQATRFSIAGGSNIVTGVTDEHLADDLFLEYSRIVTQNVFVTAGASASFAGKGLDDAAGTNLPTWYGGFINLVVNY